jgi:hypothetical protein
MIMSEAQFKADGFTHVFCEPVEQMAWVRKARVETLAYLHEHVESDDIRGVMEALTIITENLTLAIDGKWDIRIIVPAADYVEGPYSLRSHEGRQSYEDAALAPSAVGEAPARRNRRPTP